MKPLFLHIPLSEKILFARHLSIMIRTGMPLLDSLRLFLKQTKSGSFAYVLKQVIANVENGQFLAMSLGQFQRLFGDLFINIVRIGETGGVLSENLEHLSIELKKRQILHQKIRSALIYPAIVLIAMTVVISILIFFVLPKIIPIFTSLNVELPLTTKILIALATFLLNYWMFVAVGIVAFLIIFSLLLRVYAFRYACHRFLLVMPLVGTISRKAAMSDLARTLGLLLKSGVKIVEAINVTSNSITNLVYKKSFSQAAEAMKKGDSLNAFLKTREDIFPSALTQMIEVGESTGTLENNLFYLANFYEEEVDEATSNLSSTLEPILLLVMGVIVGFVAISIITPIYKITQPL